VPLYLLGEGLLIIEGETDEGALLHVPLTSLVQTPVVV
jgi:hypothetical protein